MMDHFAFIHVVVRRICLRCAVESAPVKEKCISHIILHFCCSEHFAVRATIVVVRRSCLHSSVHNDVGAHGTCRR